MIPQRISLVTLGVRNMAVLRRFYQHLGWKETQHASDTYSVFQTAGVLLSLYPIQELARDAGVHFSKTNEHVSPITLSINVDQREAVDEAIRLAELAGARVLRRPDDAFWGGRMAYFADPENNLWEVAWNPTAVFDERGAMISF